MLVQNNCKKSRVGIMAVGREEHHVYLQSRYEEKTNCVRDDVTVSVTAAKTLR